jgi:hypothetical protein
MIMTSYLKSHPTWSVDYVMFNEIICVERTGGGERHKLIGGGRRERERERGVSVMY